MLLWADHAALINEELINNSDPSHVDSCDWSFDNKSGTFSATFVSERFATVTMTKKLTTDANGVHEADLVVLARYASLEIERNLNEMGCMSMFNLSTSVTQEELPDGVGCTFVPEELKQEDAEAEALDFWASISA
jgi:hypothetical protein